MTEHRIAVSANHPAEDGYSALTDTIWLTQEQFDDLSEEDLEILVDQRWQMWKNNLDSVVVKQTRKSLRDDVRTQIRVWEEQSYMLLDLMEQANILNGSNLTMMRGRVESLANLIKPLSPDD